MKKKYLQKPLFIFAALSGALAWAPASAAEDALYQVNPSQPLAFSGLYLIFKSDTHDLEFTSLTKIVEHYSDVGMIDRTHAIMNDKFVNLLYQLDDVFGDSQPISRKKQSRARIRFDTVKDSKGNIETKGSIKIRVVLPRTEEKLRLLFSSEDDEETGSRPSRGSASTNGDEDFSVALRFIQQAKKSGLLNFDLGGRFRDRKIQLFTRLNFYYDRDIPLNFRTTFSNSLYLFSSSGLENKFRANLTQPINESESAYYRSSFELTWRESRSGAVIGGTIGIYADLDEKRSIAAEGLTSYTTVLADDDIDNFLGTSLRIRFRHNIWRPWFFYEVWPTISWEPENDFDTALGGLFRIEVALGKF